MNDPGEMTWKGKRLRDMTKDELVELCAHVLTLHLASIAEKHGIEVDDLPIEH